MIEVKNISFYYGKEQILNDVSFTMEAGECTAVLGNNGVGKSTLMTCLNKIHTPASGKVLIDGKDILSMGRSELARSAAYVAQKSELSRMTVFDCVLLGRKPYIKWSVSQEDLEICDQMIEKVGMESFRLRYVDELSGGELQKVMLARALVQKPKLLLLDEPTSNLDPRNQCEMLQLVRDLACEQGISVMIIIHDLNLALKYCDRFLLLRDGSVYACGGPKIITKSAIEDVYGIGAQVIEWNERKIVVIG